MAEAQTVTITPEQHQEILIALAHQTALYKEVAAEIGKPKPDLDKVVDTIEKADQEFDKAFPVPEKTLLRKVATHLVFQNAELFGTLKELDKLIPSFEEATKIAGKGNAKLVPQGEDKTPIGLMNSLIDQNGKIGMGDVHSKSAAIDFLAANAPYLHGSHIWLEYLDRHGNKPNATLVDQKNGAGTAQSFNNLIDKMKAEGKNVVGIDVRTGFISLDLMAAVTNYEWSKNLNNGTGVLIGGLNHFNSDIGGKIDDIVPMPVFMSLQGQGPAIGKVSNNSPIADFVLLLPSEKAPTMADINAGITPPANLPPKSGSPSRQ